MSQDLLQLFGEPQDDPLDAVYAEARADRTRHTARIHRELGASAEHEGAFVAGDARRQPAARVQHGRAGAMKETPDWVVPAGLEARTIAPAAIELDVVADIRNMEPYVVEQIILHALAEFSLGGPPMGQEEARRWLSAYVQHVGMGKSPINTAVRDRTRYLYLAPRPDEPWYGRTSAAGHILTTPRGARSGREADEAIPGGWPMVNYGEGWDIDESTDRVPYSPPAEVSSK